MKTRNSPACNCCGSTTPGQCCGCATPPDEILCSLGRSNWTQNNQTDFRVPYFGCAEFPTSFVLTRTVHPTLGSCYWRWVSTTSHAYNLPDDPVTGPTLFNVRLEASLYGGQPTSPENTNCITDFELCFISANFSGHAIDVFEQGFESQTNPLKLRIYSGHLSSPEITDVQTDGTLHGYYQCGSNGSLTYTGDPSSFGLIWATNQANPWVRATYGFSVNNGKWGSVLPFGDPLAYPPLALDPTYYPLCFGLDTKAITFAAI